MDQQCSAIVKDYIQMKCSDCPRLAVTNALSLNLYWSLVWSMTVCWMLDQLSVGRHLNSLTSQSVDRPAPVVLHVFCNPQDESLGC